VPIRRGIIVAAVATAALLATGVTPASAHAELRRTAPTVGGAVATAPAEVMVTFSEPLEPAFSSVVVRDAVGKRVDKADARLDPNDRTTMRVSLEQLPQGIYIVVWRALTKDTHRTDGAFIFRVGE
jgi:methionine-rich copper-binding protein CopC